jgi:hypothetical protein
VSDEGEDDEGDESEELLKGKTFEFEDDSSDGGM